MCQGKEVCGSHLYGFFKGKDPCPAKDTRWTQKSVPQRTRKYLTVRFSCEKAEESSEEMEEEVNSNELSTVSTSVISTSTSATPARYDDDTEQLENALFDKLDALSEINGEAQAHVSAFLETALNSIQQRSAFDNSAPRTTILNITERVSNKLM